MSFSDFSPVDNPAPVALRSPAGQTINALSGGLIRQGLVILTTILGVWVTLPWLAPVFAKLGWWGAANAIYTAYIFFCHQLPERAASLFGYQVAWCYRNAALYTALFLTGVLYLTLGRAGRGPRWFREGISWRVLVLCTLPILLDGLSHMFGLRTDNAWFDALTGGRFGDFSVGDTAGTLNWWLRILTGGLFGAAAAVFFYPRIQRVLDEETARMRSGYPAAPPAGVETTPVA